MLGKAIGSVLYQLKINVTVTKIYTNSGRFGFVYSYLENAVALQYGQSINFTVQYL
jgi:hypothetical protein